MADGTAIEWADATLNFIKARHRETGRIGDFCIKLSRGCKNCYAEGNNVFRGNGLLYKAANLARVEIILNEAKLYRPLGWRKPRLIFPLSLTDLFADFVPDWMVDRFLAVVALTPTHRYLVLTKRSARMRAYFAGAWRARVAYVVGAMVGAGTISHLAGAAASQLLTDGEILPNLLLGVSVEDQVSAGARVPDLLRTPAAFRVVSAEPLVGPVDFSALPAGDRAGWYCPLTGDHQLQPAHADHRGARLDLVIVGGESGPRADPAFPAWIEAIHDQCAGAGTAFFFKQWGSWAWAPPDLGYEDAVQWLRLRYGGATIRCFENGRTAARIGKTRAGRLLFGREHLAMPELRQPERIAA